MLERDGQDGHNMMLYHTENSATEVVDVQRAVPPLDHCSIGDGGMQAKGVRTLEGDNEVTSTLVTLSMVDKWSII